MSLQPPLTILFLGDVIGKPGRHIVTRYLQTLENKPDLIIANIENAAHGFGVSLSHLNELKEAGVQVFSGGNHTFDRKEIFDFIDHEPYLLRPANYPEKTAGRGLCFIPVNGVKVAVLNLMGRVFMEPLRSPFAVANDLLAEINKQTNIIIVDMHAEATAEKIAMGWYLNGQVSAVVGTHTHVQTADERILPGGTAYITDLGACGPINGVIGMAQAGVFRRMIDQLPARFEVADGPAAAHGALINIDPQSGRATDIQRIRFCDEA